MYSISLRDFRGFHDIDFIDIRPITVLIGENSAGKTSFLAALKYVFDLIQNDKEASFNNDPFQLGTFEQIAHYRGGKAGRAKEFRILLRRNVNLSKKDSVHYSGNITFCVTFASSESQSAISNVSISTEQDSLKVSVNDKGIDIRYISNDGSEKIIEDMKDISRGVRSEFSRYWPFVLRDLRFRLRRGNDSDQTSLFGANVEQRVELLAELSEFFSRRMIANVEATSAIRTKPLRTYTPSAEKRDGEGSHVPFEMAKLYRSKGKDSWNKVKSAIELFGISSEMFKKIDIKSFGRTGSDPFQIQLSSDGPKTNIVDLGYGNSQVLPILYSVATAPKGGVFLIQQPEVHLHPKAQAALGSFFVESYINDRKEFILETHSDFIVDRIRQAVASKKIGHGDVSILFFERKKLENTVSLIDLDESGAPINPPDSYRSFFSDEQLRNLGF